MNLKSLSIVSAAMLAGLLAPTAQAVTLVPATYASGVVTAVDAAGLTLTVEGTTYAVQGRSLLDHITPGNEVDVALVTLNGKTTAIAVQLTATGDEAELIY